MWSLFRFNRNKYQIRKEESINYKYVDINKGVGYSNSSFVAMWSWVRIRENFERKSLLIKTKMKRNFFVSQIPIMLTLFRFIKRLLRDIFRTNWWRNGEKGRHDYEHSDSLFFNFYAKCHFFQCRYAGAATLGITTCGIMTLGIKASVVTLSIATLCQLNVVAYLSLCWMSLYLVLLGRYAQCCYD
jgi:hypothetical protein